MILTFINKQWKEYYGMLLWGEKSWFFSAAEIITCMYLFEMFIDCCIWHFRLYLVIMFIIWIVGTMWWFVQSLFDFCRCRVVFWRMYKFSFCFCWQYRNQYANCCSMVLCICLTDCMFKHDITDLCSLRSISAHLFFSKHFEARFMDTTIS